MKKTALFLVPILAAFILFVLNKSPMNKDFTFNGETYKHVKEKSGGIITNHFYTPDGIEYEKATTFIQVLEFDNEKIKKSEWMNSLKPLFNRYQLKPHEEDGFEFSGKARMAGFYYKTYAAPIAVGETEHMAIFIIGSAEEMDDDSEEKVAAIIHDIKNIQFE